MKAHKAKLKVPKKPERIGSKSDVIKENFIALFHDDYRICEENLYTLFTLKDEVGSILKLDLHNGKLYLFASDTVEEAFYYNMPYYLKNGGKGAGKYKHLNENNWQRLTDREKAQALYDARHPAPVERVCTRPQAQPDVEAYYIYSQTGEEQKCVYWRKVAEETWRVFYAKSYEKTPLFSPYACSEKTLKDILQGADRRSKDGQIDCCDRLLGADEVQYLCTRIPAEHALKRPKGLAVADTEDEQTCINAYYWKKEKPICCADEAYIPGLFAALEEAATCSVAVEFVEEPETPALEPNSEQGEPEDVSTKPEAQVAEADEEPVETQEMPEEAASFVLESEEPLSDGDPETEEESSSAQLQERSEEEQALPETDAVEVRESVEQPAPEKTKMKWFSRRKKKEKPAPQESEEALAVSKEEPQSELPAQEETAALPEIPTTYEALAQEVLQAQESEQNVSAQETQEESVTPAEKEEAPEIEEAAEQAEEVPKEAAAILEQEAAQEAPPAEEQATEESTAQSSAAVQEAPVQKEQTAPSAEPQVPEEAASELFEAGLSEPLTQANAPEKAVDQVQPAEQPPLSAQEPMAAQSEDEPKETAPKPVRTARAKKPSSKKQGAGTAVEAVQADFSLAQLVSAYAASGRKKIKPKAQIIAAMPRCPLIVPISAENYTDASWVYVSKKAATLCGDKIIAFTALADKQPLLPGEENAEVREGVMVKTVVSRTKAYIPVFSDFKSAEQAYGKQEKFGIFTLKNLLSHIEAAQSIEGLSLNPSTVNLKLYAQDFADKK